MKNHLHVISWDENGFASPVSGKFGTETCQKHCKIQRDLSGCDQPNQYCVNSFGKGLKVTESSTSNLKWMWIYHSSNVQLSDGKCIFSRTVQQFINSNNSINSICLSEIVVSLSIISLKQMQNSLIKLDEAWCNIMIP